MRRRLTPDNPCGTLVGTGPLQIPERRTPWGLRTVDGSCNNLYPGQERFAAADQPFPRLTTPRFKAAEGVQAGFFGPGSPAVASSSYAQKKGDVFDSRPRTVSNLIVDQTSTNPAAVAAAGFPVRTQGNDGVVPCTTDPVLDTDGSVLTPGSPTVNAQGNPAECVPSHKTLFIPNVTTDVGLSPPYNSVFTFFGQFFDHGVDQTVKSGGTVYVPLKADDPLIARPGRQSRHRRRAAAEPALHGAHPGAEPARPRRHPRRPTPGRRRTRAPTTSRTRTTPTRPGSTRARPTPRTPRTRPSCASTCCNAAGRPVDTGALLGGMPGTNGATGMATWESTKKQAADLLGLRLVDRDVTNIPMLAADPYGNFIPGPARGLPQYVTDTGLVEGNRAAPVPVPANVKYFDTPFLTDIAHNADPSPQDTDHNPGTPPVAPTPDADNVASADFASQPAGTYDDEMLNAHFIAGDGRVNENIALSAIHQVFHSEHDRLVPYIKDVLLADVDEPACRLRRASRPPRHGSPSGSCPRRRTPPAGTASGSSRRLGS